MRPFFFSFFKSAKDSHRRRPLSSSLLSFVEEYKLLERSSLTAYMAPLLSFVFFCHHRLCHRRRLRRCGRVRSGRIASLAEIRPSPKVNLMFVTSFMYDSGRTYISMFACCTTQLLCC